MLKDSDVFQLDRETPFQGFLSFSEGRSTTGFNSLPAEWGWLRGVSIN